MPYKIEAACPCCGKTAYGIEEIERLFGWRKPDNKQIPQCYETFENENTKYIATTVEAVLGAIYRQNADFRKICELVESWMQF